MARGRSPQLGHALDRGVVSAYTRPVSQVQKRPRRAIHSTTPREAARDARFRRVQAVARARGGVCLSTEYVDACTHLRWRCAEGHEWEAVPYSVARGTWCRRCAGYTIWTIDDMHALSRARGGECLSTEFVNTNTCLRWRCAEGHEWEARPNHVVRGTWCPHCAGGRAWTIDEMRGLARARGGTCLSRRYLGTNTRLRWRCAEGHEWESAPGNVTQGKWCPHCAGNARLTIDDMHRAARARGGECLSKRYVNARTHLRWRCAEGHEWEGQPYHVEQQGTWCPYCAGNASLTIDDMHEAARAWGGECLSRSYSPSRPVLRWRCAVGHEWSADAHVVRQNKWCPRCRRQSRGTIERVRDVVTRKGGVLLDARYRSSTTPLRVRCSAGHEWRTPAISIMSGTWCHTCWHESLRGQPSLHPTIHDMQEIAASRGGACLSEFYVNRDTKLRWQCHAGHEWDARPSSIRRSWCPRCAHQHRGTIDGMRALAVARGGVCLSDTYHNHRDPLRFGCARGHVFTATGMMVKSGVWCPKCADRGQAAARSRGVEAKPPITRSRRPAAL